MWLCDVERRDQPFLVELTIGIGSIFAMEGFVDIAGHDVVVVGVCCMEGSESVRQHRLGVGSGCLVGVAIYSYQVKGGVWKVEG